MSFSNSFFNPDEALERGQKVLKNQAQITTQTLKGQVTGQQQPQVPTDGAKAMNALPDQGMKDFIQDMYAPSDGAMPAQQTQQLVSQLGGGNATQDPTKLAETRKLLAEHTKQHMDMYYKPTFEASPHREERPAEKIEREEAEDAKKRWELQEEEKKKNEVPLALRMAKNKAEMFRGAAG